MIHFDAVAKEARILSPLNNFEPTTQPVEHRWDPLTRRSAIVIKGRMDYVRRFIESDPQFLSDLVQSTGANCPFCPSAVFTKSPKLIPEIAPEGRIQVGDAVCFPSLFAHNDYNAVVVPSKSHVLGLKEFTAEMLTDGIRACLVFFQRVRKFDLEAKYPAIVMNFLPPAGSTISHFHMQALASSVPFAFVQELLEASEKYAQKGQESYWEELVETERRLGVRYLAEYNDVHWLTPYAPLGLNDVQAVVSGKSSLDQITDSSAEGLVAGILRVLGYYDEVGVRSFNTAVYSGPLGERNDFFDLNFRMVSRYGYRARFVSDIWAIQYLLGEREIYETPEETCLKVRKYFG